MSEPIRKYKFVTVESTYGRVRPIAPPGKEPNSSYIDYYTGKPLKYNDLIWTRNNTIVKGSDLLARRDYALLYGNPRFETDLLPITVIHDKTTGNTHTRLGDIFEDRYADLLKAPTANLIGLKYNQQTPYLENNDIQEAAHFDKLAADRLVRNRSMSQFNKTEMNNLANLTLNLGGAALLAPGAVYAPIATLGALVGATAGAGELNKLIDHYSKYNSWEDAVEHWTNGYIRKDNAAFTNPGAWAGGATYGWAFPAAVRYGSIFSPTNKVTRFLGDISNLFGETGLLLAIEEGRYIRNTADLKRHLIKASLDIQDIKSTISNLLEPTKHLRWRANDPDRTLIDLPTSFDEVKIKFLGLKEGSKEAQGGASASYFPYSNEIEIPFYERINSNISRDFSKGKSLKDAAHELEHAFLTSEKYDLDIPTERYFAPNPKHVAYPATKILEKRPTSWAKSVDELDADVMAYRVANNGLPSYNNMTLMQKLKLLLELMPSHYLLPHQSHKILSTLSKYGY